MIVPLYHDVVQHVGECARAGVPERTFKEAENGTMNFRLYHAIPYAQRLQVSLLIRCNQSQMVAASLSEDLTFADGSIPAAHG